VRLKTGAGIDVIKRVNWLNVAPHLSIPKFWHCAPIIMFSTFLDSIRPVSSSSWFLSRVCDKAPYC